MKTENVLKPFSDNSFDVKTHLSSHMYDHYRVTEKANPPVIISEIIYNTPLNENIANGQPYSNGEFIKLYNPNNNAILDGWKLTGDGKTEIVNFPANTVIKANSTLIVAYQHKMSGLNKCNSCSFHYNSLSLECDEGGCSPQGPFAWKPDNWSCPSCGDPKSTFIPVLFFMTFILVSLRI